MGTQPVLLASDVPLDPVRPSVRASTYLALVGRFHDRFLAALTDARATLGNEPGHLAEVAAQQRRLTAMFLDAQRSILRLWAEADAEVAMILEGSIDVPPYGSGTGTEVDAVGGGGETPRGRSDAGHDDLERELRSLLDGWWGDERRLGEALVAAARIEPAAVASGANGPVVDDRRWAPSGFSITAPRIPDVVSTGSHPPSPPAPDLGLAGVERALAGAAPSGLLAILDGLIETLAAEEAAAAWVDDARSAAQSSESPDRSGAESRPAGEAFDRFWGSAGRQRRSRTPFRTRVYVQVVPPLAVTVGLLVAVLAWIG